MDQSDFDALKARVAELEYKLEFVSRRLNIEYVEGDKAEAVNSKVRALLLQGNKIEAIKAYREIYKIGLAEAKQAVDAMERGVH
jgi:ribosomal protein L7/L12